MIDPDITLGLSSHRPEMLPILSEWMQRHKAIFLEEPRSAGFNRMLRGELGIDEYMMPLDLEYPAFSRRLYQLVRELSHDGKKILQVEPYLDVLIEIHDAFADGMGPDEMDRASIHYPVYLAEKKATGSLLAYYQAVVAAPFEEVVNAVSRFAIIDAARFRLRDSLRAQEIARLSERYSSIYVEAGEMHYSLLHQLRRLSDRRLNVRLVFLSGDLDPDLKLRRNLYSPGDRLTLLYLFHPQSKQKKRIELLAARSLIYSKIVHKEEITTGAEDLPHLRDELKCNHLTSLLSWNDCRYLFDEIRQSKTSQAYQLVSEYVGSTKGREVEHEGHTI